MTDEIYYFRESELPELLDGATPKVFKALRGGLAGGRVVEIGYQDWQGEFTTRRILPEAFVFVDDFWYVAAFCLLRGEPRSFRFDRIVFAYLTDTDEPSHGVADNIRANGVSWKREVAIPAPPRSPAEDEAWEREWQRRSLNYKFIDDIKYDRGEEMEKDLAAGADINCRNVNGDTALIVAASHGNLATLRYLVERGADLNLRGQLGETALIAVSRYGSMEVVRYLVEELGFDLNAQDHYGWSPLHLAARVRSLDLVEYYLARGADIALRDRQNGTVLMSAINAYFPDDGKSLEVVKLLLSHGAELDAEDRRGRTALFFAAEHSLQQCVDFLLDSGADVRHRDHFGNSILLYLLGETWQHRRSFTADDGRFDIFKQFVECGADINAANRRGFTPLMLAPNEWVEFMLEHGADPNAADEHGYTAAMYHAESLPVLRLLAKYGADLSRRDDAGNDVLLLATPDWKHVSELVGKFGLSPNSRNAAGETILHRASVGGSLAAVKFLVRRGADPEAKDNEGRTPWDLVEEEIYHENADEAEYDISDYLSSIM